MTGPVPLWVELCAGTAALTLRLIGGRFCRPPVSRMGSKSGYGEALLSIAGLRAGQGAEAVLLCEPDDGCRALLQAYPQPEVLREAAEIIRSWADEDPRELWERLRAEGPIRGASGGEVARWAYVTGQSVEKRPTGASWFTRPNGEGQKSIEGYAEDLERLAASELARWARITTSNRLVNVDPHTWMNTGQGGTKHGGEDFSTGAEDLARGFEGVSAREVGRWVSIGHLSYRDAQPESGFGVAQGYLTPKETKGPIAGRADILESGAASWPPVTVCADCREIDPEGIPEGTVCYIDPPYLGDGSQKITGYGHGLTREEVVAMATSWSDAGARVMISECAPLTDDLGPGWQAVNITATRKGQKRTFSTEQGRTEWVTVNFEPHWRPSQLGLFS